MINIKGILGYCQAEGCKNKYDYEAEINFHMKNGKVKKKKAKLCSEHAIKLMKGGQVKSVTFEETINY